MLKYLINNDTVVLYVPLKNSKINLINLIKTCLYTNINNMKNLKITHLN